MTLPSASVYSTRSRVSVYSTGGCVLLLSGFSREQDYQRYPIGPGSARYSQVSARTVDLPAVLGAYALQPPIPSGGGCVTSPSPRRARSQ